MHLVKAGVDGIGHPIHCGPDAGKFAPAAHAGSRPPVAGGMTPGDVNQVANSAVDGEMKQHADRQDEEADCDRQAFGLADRQCFCRLPGTMQIVNHCRKIGRAAVRYVQGGQAGSDVAIG